MNAAWRAIREQAESLLTPRQKWEVARARADLILAREWDESKHPRGQSSPGTTPGSFTSAGGGEGGAEETAKLDPEVVGVGGDAWNKSTARRLEKEYQAARPAVDKLATDAAARSAEQTKPPSSWAEVSASDKAQIKSEFEQALEDDPQWGDLNKWDKQTDEEKLKWAVEQGYFKNKPQAVGPQTWAEVSEDAKEAVEAAYYEHVNLTGFLPLGVPWDKVSDDKKLQWAKDHGYAAGAVEEEPYEEPSSWEELSDDDQSAAEEAFVEKQTETYHESEVQNWHDSGQSENDAKAMLIYEFEHAGQGVMGQTNVQLKIPEWIEKAINDYREDETNPTIPYTNEQLFNALSLDTKYGSGEGPLTVAFKDDKLQEPSMAPPKEQQSFAGMEPIDYSKQLTDEMRIGLITSLKVEFNKEAENKVSDMEPPEYLTETAQEYAGDAWNEMSDAKKFEWAYGNTDIIKKKDEGGGAASSDDPSTMVIELPKKYDPLNETTGQDYKRTQKLARYLSIERTVQMLEDRKLVPEIYVPEQIKKGTPEWEAARIKALHQDIADADRRLWRGWVSSSTTSEGQLLQLATSEELGGRFKAKTATEMDVAGLKSGADLKYREIGGYAGVKAYIRAKWEVTQYLLDKADAKVINLYRGISMDPELVQKFFAVSLSKHMSESQFVNAGKGTYRHMPTLPVDRNGAASTSLNPMVSNGWKKGNPNQIVLRAQVPRTAAISIPAYGQNEFSEREVVVAGTAWKGWDAWKGPAPTWEELPVLMPHAA